MDTVLDGQVTKVKHIKADLPEILKPTCFSCMKDFKAVSFLIATDINADLLKLENKAKM
jgi:hypothetical protein